MRRAARFAFGSVVYDRRRRSWHWYYYENGTRHSRRIGSRDEFPNKSSAQRAAMLFRESGLRGTMTARLTAPRELKAPAAQEQLLVRNLVEQYRSEKMPKRASTRRGYNSYFSNYVLPRWGEHYLTELRARPVELWLKSITTLERKSKVHIRGVLSSIWRYAMWAELVPKQLNPMQDVDLGEGEACEPHRVLTEQEFQSLLGQFADDLCFRTLLLVMMSFGLRISETLGLKWKDVDWLACSLRIVRGVVKQVEDKVKTKHSARTLVIADCLLTLLQGWKQQTQFPDPDNWVFASPAKLGRLPLSYTYVWTQLDRASVACGIGHISSHCFRHTYRSWLDREGTPVGVQQRLMRHADIRTTMNIYGDVFTDDMKMASEKIARRAFADLNSTQTARGNS